MRFDEYSANKPCLLIERNRVRIGDRRLRRIPPSAPDPNVPLPARTAALAPLCCRCDFRPRSTGVPIVTASALAGSDSEIRSSSAGARFVRIPVARHRIGHVLRTQTSKRPHRKLHRHTHGLIERLRSFDADGSLIRARRQSGRRDRDRVRQRCGSTARPSCSHGSPEVVTLTGITHELSSNVWTMKACEYGARSSTVTLIIGTGFAMVGLSEAAIGVQLSPPSLERIRAVVAPLLTHRLCCGRRIDGRQRS